MASTGSHCEADAAAGGGTDMKTFLLRFFTWWNGQTFGTQVWTALYGEFVGSDEFGNRYYRTKGGKIDPSLGFERRWVTYNGVAEASTIPPSWHGWMHHMVDVPPTLERVEPRPWWKPHRPESHRHARRPAPDRLDPGAGPPAEGHRRLQAVDARGGRRWRPRRTSPGSAYGAALSPPYSPC